MNVFRRTVVGIFAAGLSGVGFAQGVHVSGRVMDVKGRPLIGNNTVFLTPVDGGHAASALWVSSNYDGRFSISGVPPKEYEVHVTSKQFKVLPATLFIDGPDDVELGDIVARPDASSDFRVEQVVVDSLAIQGGFLRTQQFSLA